MKWIKLLAINFLVLLVLIKIFDLFIKTDRNIELPTKRYIHLREHSPNTNLLLEPTDEYLKQTENLIKQKYKLTTDSNGFIIGPLENTNSQNNADIIFFGGSTTECLFVKEENRFPYLVGKLFKNKIVKTKNAGVSGNTTINSSLNLISKGLSLNPKFVVLMENINDLSLLSKTGTYFKAPINRSVIQIKEDEGILTSLKNFLKGLRDVFCPNLYEVLIINQKRKTQKDEWEKFRDNDSIPLNIIEKEFEMAVKTFISIAKSNNIKVILMTQFNRFNSFDDFSRTHYKNQISYNTYCQYYKALNDKIRIIAKENSVILIDLENKVPANGKYIYDFVHLNDAGSTLVANIIYKEIYQLL